MSRHIKIDNPLSGEGWTSMQAAKRYVARGLAGWSKFGISIRFVRNDDYRECAARASVSRSGRPKNVIDEHYLRLLGAAAIGTKPLQGGLCSSR
jgi:hypothetical protein